MFRFFKRFAPRTAPTETRSPARAAAPAAGRSRLDYPPAPLPEVTEGNTEADWSLWEDSVNSQLAPLPGDTGAGDIGAFDKVSKRDG